MSASWSDGVHKVKSMEISKILRPAHTLDLNSVSALHEHDENTERVDSSAKAVSKFHTHSIPLDMEDIERDWDKPVAEAGIAAKASVIVRVGMLDLGAGTGSFRVREMMHRIAYPLGVHVRADVNLTDIEASCTDGKDRRRSCPAGAVVLPRRRDRRRHRTAA